MTPEAQLAEHERVLASLTREQKLAINRRDYARRQSNFNHRTERENLIALFERPEP